jgi:hypothetical protein
VSLVASRLCLDFAEIWVIKTYAQFSKELYPIPRRSSNPYRQEDERDMIVPVLQADVGESSELYREAGQACLVSYARTIGYMLTYKVESALHEKSWTMATEASKYPVSVSPFWKDIVAELDTIERMVDIVYPLDPILVFLESTSWVHVLQQIWAWHLFIKDWALRPLV